MARPRIEWTDEMLEEMVINYPILSNPKLSEMLQVSVSSIRRKAKEMQLLKSSVGGNRFEKWNIVEEMFGKHSNREIARAAHVSERTVRRICKRLELELTQDERGKLVSEGVLKGIKSEKRRILFGLEQRTDRFIGKDKARNRMWHLLAEKGYVVIRGSMTVYCSDTMRRHEHIEAYAVSLGFTIEVWETV